MASKTKNSMFGAVEDIPKRLGNFTGRTVDEKKLNYLNELFTSFTAFAKANTLEDGQQVPVADLGGYTVTSLESVGNKLLSQQDAGFYLVATDRPVGEDGKYGQPTKLVIRIGKRPTRTKKSDSNGDGSDES